MEIQMKLYQDYRLLDVTPCNLIHKYLRFG